jgi:hypothetical protein
MASFYGQWRSNYFVVKNLGEFTQWINRIGNIRLVSMPNVQGSVAMFSEGDGTLPSCEIDMEYGDRVFFEDVYDGKGFIDVLATFLDKDEVAIIMAVGQEGERYVSGHALAVKWDGEILDVHLSDIYDKVKHTWRIVPSEAAY